MQGFTPTSAALEWSTLPKVDCICDAICKKVPNVLCVALCVCKNVPDTKNLLNHVKRKQAGILFVTIAFWGLQGRGPAFAQLHQLSICS